MTTQAQSPTEREHTASGEFERLLAMCVARDASDLHLVESQPPLMRVHGPLERLDAEPPMSREAMAAIAGGLSDRFDADGPGSIDGSFSAADGTRFRFNIFLRSGGVAIALRRLEDRFRALDELGLPDALYALCDLPNGLVVVSGSTGAGKSTTLATLIDRINQSHPCHVITIEDPIEYVHASRRALVNQREVGKDTGGFNEALIASLRQDPDVILVGEIRDVGTIRTAITASETGHLVFTTVHAGDCVSTIERLVGVFPADEQDAIRQQLALVLRAIVNQRLLVADGDAVADADRLLGGRSRVVASEILMATPAVANLILNRKSSQIYSAMEAGGSLGMQTLEQDLARLWAAGIISERTAVTGARRGDVVRDRYEALRGAGTSEPKSASRRGLGAAR